MGLEDHFFNMQLWTGGRMAKAVSEGEGIVETILNLHFNIFFIGKIPGEEMATQSSILTWKNSIDRGAWQAVVHGVTSERTHTHKLFIGNDFQYTENFQ